ncbi:uncharacterized protein I303_105974 [Kwoniella dejecticola CBS 10117]|uniref:Phospholipid binding protein n=1 Tax=Kwoniella dejecticola CBS 10117 TaxID=1296121 RepID=A0AAJ8KS93_9TREE
MALTVRAVHTFMAEHGDELEFQAGEEIVVLEKDEAFGDGWWRPLGLPETTAAPQTSSANGTTPASDTHLAAPTIPIPDESPRGTHDAEGGLLDNAVAAVETTAASVGNVMGRTIGEIQDAIESITAKPESDDEEELGIGQNARAKLAEQARLANEQREKNQQTSNGGVAGLVYSDESEDEDEEMSRSPRGNGVRNIDSPILNGFHSSPVALDPNAIPKTAPTLSAQSSAHSVKQFNPATGALEPPAHIPSTPPFEKPAFTSRSSASGIPSKPVPTWTVDDVVSWAQAKGFDEGIPEKFRGESTYQRVKLTLVEHEITGDLLLELDANLLKELDIPQFGKRMRIAAAISELRRPSSMVSSNSQQLSPSGLPLSQPGSASMRGMSAPPASLGQPFPSTTPPLTTPPASASSNATNDDIPHSAWAHGRKTSNVGLGMPTPMAAINEMAPSSNQASSTAASLPASPVTPNSALTKRESTGSMGHKRGKPSTDNKERLSFFGRSRKPAPPNSVSPSSEQHRTSSRLGFPSSNRVHQMQPATPEANRRASGNGAGNAAALKQIGTPDYSGYLKKKGDRYGGWKQRFFVLKGSHLYFMKSEHEDRVKGHIELQGHRLIVDENTNPGSYGFRLTGGPNDKAHYFSSTEQIAIREWMKALMKATIARDYSVPVTSSCNIPTIPLAEAQALAPRPPSPATREATQRATRRENPNQLTAHDANILLGATSPGRPSRDTRRPSSNYNGAARPTSSFNEGARPSVHSGHQSEDNLRNDNPELVKWVNSLLPQAYPRASAIPKSFVSGEVVFLLVKHLSGIEPSPPVPPQAFAPDASGQPGLEGLFSMMDILIDAGVDTAGVSINDVRNGDSAQISKLLNSIRGWHEEGAGTAR